MSEAKKASIAYLLTVFILVLGSSILIPIIPFYVIDLGIGMGTLGLISSVSQIFIALASLLIPVLMPVTGYFRTFALGTFLVVLSRLAYVGSVALHGSLMAFAVGYVLSSLRMPVIFTSRTAIVAEYVPSRRRATAMGAVSAVAMLASCMGPYLGSYLYEGMGLGYLGAFTASLGLTAFSLTPLAPVLINDPTKSRWSTNLKEEVSGLAKVFGLPKLKRALLLFSLDSFTWGLVGPFTSIYYAKVLNAVPYELATVTLITNVISIGFFPFSGALSDKLRRRVPFLALSEAAGIMYFSLILLAEDMKLVYLASSLMALVITFWGPLAGTLITELAEEADKSLVPSAISAWSTLRQVLRIPASLIGGLMFDANPRAPFEVTIALLCLLAMLLSVLLSEAPQAKRDKGQPAGLREA